MKGEYNLLLNCDYEEKNSFLKHKAETLNLSFNEKDPNFNEEEYQKNQAKYAGYVNLFSPIKLENYLSKNYIIYNKFLKIFKDDLFTEFIDYVMELRYKKVVGDHAYIFEQTIPKKIFNYRELRDNPDLLDQIIDDDRSSNNSDDEN